MKTYTVAFLILTSLSAQTLPQRSGKWRVFVGESEAFFASSFNVASSSATANAFQAKGSGHALGMSSAGIQKYTLAVMQEIHDRCGHAVEITSKPDSADLFIRLDMDQTMLTVHARMAVFDRTGTMLFIASGHRIKDDAKKFCQNIAQSSYSR